MTYAQTNSEQINVLTSLEKQKKILEAHAYYSRALSVDSDDKGNSVDLDAYLTYLRIKNVNPKYVVFGQQLTEEQYDKFIAKLK